MSLRIIAGERRGALLKTPPGRETRPTLGRVRTSLFGILTPWLRGAVVLDVFAGSGALGLEALSRGAARAHFIEQSPEALVALRANIDRLNWQDRARVMPCEALAFLSRPAPPGDTPYDLIFLDPPYGVGLCDAALRWLAPHAGAWLVADGWLAAQVGRNDPLDETYGGFVRVRRENYSQTRIDFFRLVLENK